MYKHESNVTPWKRLVAFVLLAAMLVGMMPTSVVTAEETAAVGTVEAISAGGTTANSAVTFSNVELNWEAADAALGRNEDGWWLGMKVLAPADMIRAEQFSGENGAQVTYQVRGVSGQWSEAASFWDSQDSDKNTEETARYLNLWGLVNVERLRNAVLAGTDLAYDIQIDWNMDGSYEQLFSLVVDADAVVLKKDGVEVYPASRGYGVVSTLTEGGVVSGNVVHFAQKTLYWEAADAALGRNEDGWWLGIKIAAPAAMTSKADFVDEENGKMAVLQVRGSGEWSQSMSIWDNQESNKNEAIAERFVTLWGKVDEQKLQSGSLRYQMRFDWDMDGVFEQTVGLDVDTASITLMKGAEQVYPEPPVEYVTIQVEKTGNGSVTINGTEVDGSIQLEKGTKAALAVTPDTGAIVKQLMIGDKAIAAKNGYEDAEFNADADMKIVAVFVNEYTVTFQAGEGRFLDVNGKALESVKVEKGEQLSFTYATNEGYELTEVKAGEEVLTAAEGIYTVTVNDHMTVTAVTRDVERPVVNASVEMADQWTNRKVINVEVSDNEGVESVFYSTSAEYANAQDLVSLTPDEHGKCKFTVSQNGTYYIYALDEAENVNSASVKAEKIDTTPPVLGDVRKYQSGKTDTYSVKVSDPESGIARVWFTENKDGSGGEDAEEIRIFGETTYKFVGRKNKKYYVFAQNNVKNVEMISNNVEEYESENRDVNAPEVYDVTEDAWNAESNTVSFKVRDDKSGVKAVYWSAQERDPVFEGIEGLTELTETDGAYSFTVQANGTYYIYAVDKYKEELDKGNWCSYAVEVVHIDEAAPVIEAFAVYGENVSTNGAWVNSDVTIKVDTLDHQKNSWKPGSGIAKVYCSTTMPADGVIPADATELDFEEAEKLDTDEIVEWLWKIPKTEDINEIYYFWAVDNVGRMSQVREVVVKIDKVKPQITEADFVRTAEAGFVSDSEKTDTFGIIYKMKTAFNVTGADQGDVMSEGELKYQYKLDGENERWLDAAAGENALSFPESLPANYLGKIYVRVTDAAGNISKEVAVENKTVVVDCRVPEAPNVEIKLGEADYHGEWTNGNVCFNLSGGTTVSGVDHYEWTNAPDTDAVNVVGEGGIEEQVDEFKLISNLLTIAADTNASYFFRTVSNAGVVSDWTEAKSVKVQKTAPDAPMITVTGGKAQDANDWYNDDVQIGMESAERNLNGPAVTLYWELTRVQPELKTEGQKDGKEDDKTVSEVIGLTEDGMYKLVTWTVDDAGNQSACTETSVWVDKSAPTDLTIDLTYRKVVDDKAEMQTDSILAESQNSASYKYFYGKENLIDGTVTIKLGANCDISGMRTLRYQMVGDLGSINENGWIIYDAAAGIRVAPDSKFILVVEAEDVAGNVTRVHSEGIIVDDKKPSGNINNETPDILMEITSKPSNGNGIFTEDVAVNITVHDPKYDNRTLFGEKSYSGLAAVRYRIYTTDSRVQSQTLDLAGEKTYENGLVHTWTDGITIKAADYDSNEVYVEVVAVDNAGNSRITTLGPIKIDVTDPTIDVVYTNDAVPENGFFYKGDRSAKITITERNIDLNQIKLIIMKDGKPYGSASFTESKLGSGNRNDRQHSATVKFDTDGDYTFEISCTDQAGRSCVDSQVSYSGGNEKEFTIDKTSPVISVSYDNNTVVNGTFFNKGRVATVSVTEHNFDEKRATIAVTAALDGAKIANPRISSWSKSTGDRYVATVSYVADGDYTFDVNVTDKAGNQDKGAGYGNSASPKAFTVDTTIIDPVITGVENGKAYKDEVKAGIMLEDENFAQYTVRLLRTRMGEKDVDVTEEFFDLIAMGEEGGTLLTENFAEIAENDGIYTLIVTMQDKAGNTSTTTTVFTVNRFGSVYVFGDYLATLAVDGGAYVTAVTEDITLTEYNADHLVKDSIRVEITRDGKPLEDVIFEVDPDVSDTVAVGESGWYQYAYTISMDNFKNDGVYKISISSRDATGNQPENSNYADKSIQFKVDSTAPEISSIVGLEETIVDAPEQEVRYSIYDTIGLKSVTVYVDGKVYGDVITEFEDVHNFDGSFILKEAKSVQHVRIVVEDMSGNIVDTDAEDFESIYAFNSKITVSTDWIVRWFANKPLFFGSLAGGAAVLALLWFLIFGKRKKKEEEVK